MKKTSKNHFWNISLFTRFNLIMGNTQTSQRLAIKNINIKIPISSPHNVVRHPGGWAVLWLVAVVPAGGESHSNPNIYLNK